MLIPHSLPVQDVSKEINIYLLAYNLLRALMWEAGTTHGVEPLRLSMQGTRQHLDNFIPHLAAAYGKNVTDCIRFF